MAGSIRPVTIREATDSDAPTIAQLASDAAMGTLSTTGHTFAALSGTELLGFIRITEAEGNHFVNPIVVAPRVRQQGVGRALMVDAHDRFGRLWFVARGSAVPFYEALGCERVPLDAIARDIAADCDSCDDFVACVPVPMVYR